MCRKNLRLVEDISCSYIRTPYLISLTIKYRLPPMMLYQKRTGSPRRFFFYIWAKRAEKILKCPSGGICLKWRKTALLRC